MGEQTFSIAIDLGGTTTKMACCRSGSVEIIPNYEGADQTVCAVWLNPQGTFVVGQEAKDALSTDAANVQTNFVRDLGTEVEYIFP
jgi:molecular chaperone DnaK (HSP70)